MRHRRRPKLLSGDVLSGFGKAGCEDIKPEGRRAVGELVLQLYKDNASGGSMEVVGHTDRIGSEAANEALGLRRAQVMRQMMIDNCCGQRILDTGLGLSGQ